MSRLQDPDYLLTEQYRDASNLNARLRLHILFSTNQSNWFRWIFDQFNLPPHCRILELGSGPGDLWLENSYRIPAEWEITISDFSTGMVEKARQNLQNIAHRFTYRIIDAQAIPYPDEHFDAVIANHVFHHVPQINKAISEIRRVLKLGGLLYATSVGERHMAELPDLVSKFDPAVADQQKGEKNEFTLESGYARLREWFSVVQTLRQENSLVITEAEPLADYIMSMAWYRIIEERRDELKRFLEQEMVECGGAISISKDSGVFIAQ